MLVVDQELCAPSSIWDYFDHEYTCVCFKNGWSNEHGSLNFFLNLYLVDINPIMDNTDDVQQKKLAKATVLLKLQQSLGMSPLEIPWD